MIRIYAKLLDDKVENDIAGIFAKYSTGKPSDDEICSQIYKILISLFSQVLPLQF